MTPAQGRLWGLLLNKFTNVVIHIPDSMKGPDKRTFIKLDPIKRGELSVRIKNKNEGCLFDVLGVHNFPACDYLYLTSAEEKQDEFDFYLIEQTDILRTYYDRLKGTFPNREKILAEVTNTINDSPISKQDKRTLKEKVIIYGIVEENLRKFYSSLAVIFYLQSKKDFAKHFPNSQTYHFFLLDIYPEERNTEARRVLHRRIRKELEKKIGGQGITPKGGRSICIAKYDKDGLPS